MRLMVRLDKGVKHMMMSSKFLFVVVVVVQLQYKLAAEILKPICLTEASLYA
jgi:hypothetical protein